MQHAAHRGNYRACSGRYEPRPGSGDVIAERGAMTSQKQPKKSPGRGPKGKTGTTGAGLRLQKGRTASTEEWLATGGKKIADRCAPVVVVEDALKAMRIIYNRHIIDPVVENESMAGSRNS